MGQLKVTLKQKLAGQILPLLTLAGRWRLALDGPWLCSTALSLETWFCFRQSTGHLGSFDSPNGCKSAKVMPARQADWLAEWLVGTDQTAPNVRRFTNTAWYMARHVFMK